MLSNTQGSSCKKSLNTIKRSASNTTLNSRGLKRQKKEMFASIEVAQRNSGIFSRLIQENIYGNITPFLDIGSLNSFIQTSSYFHKFIAVNIQKYPIPLKWNSKIKGFVSKELFISQRALYVVNKLRTTMHDIRSDVDSNDSRVAKRMRWFQDLGWIRFGSFDVVSKDPNLFLKIFGELNKVELEKIKKIANKNYYYIYVINYNFFDFMNRNMDLLAEIKPAMMKEICLYTKFHSFEEFMIKYKLPMLPLMRLLSKYHHAGLNKILPFNLFSSFNEEVKQCFEFLRANERKRYYPEIILSLLHAGKLHARHIKFIQKEHIEELHFGRVPMGYEFLSCMLCLIENNFISADVFFTLDEQQTAQLSRRKFELLVLAYPKLRVTSKAEFETALHEEIPIRQRILSSPFGLRFKNSFFFKKVFPHEITEHILFHLESDTLARKISNHIITATKIFQEMLNKSEKLMQFMKLFEVLKNLFGEEIDAVDFYCLTTQDFDFEIALDVSFLRIISKYEFISHKFLNSTRFNMRKQSIQVKLSKQVYDLYFNVEKPLYYDKENTIDNHSIDEVIILKPFLENKTSVFKGLKSFFYQNRGKNSSYYNYKKIVNYYLQDLNDEKIYFVPKVANPYLNIEFEDLYMTDQSFFPFFTDYIMSFSEIEKTQEPLKNLILDHMKIYKQVCEYHEEIFEELRSYFPYPKDMIVKSILFSRYLFKNSDIYIEKVNYTYMSLAVWKLSLFRNSLISKLKDIERIVISGNDADSKTVWTTQDTLQFQQFVLHAIKTTYEEYRDLLM